jgi:hypothetical protein
MIPQHLGAVWPDPSFVISGRRNGACSVVRHPLVIDNDMLADYTLCYLST